MSIDLSRARLLPYDHQRIGVEKMVKYPYFFLTDEMGAGKTKQTIDTIMVLVELGLIDKVLVIAPAAVRSVWFDPEFGELKKHLWEDIPVSVYEWHAKMRAWPNNPRGPKCTIFVTNYEFIRSEERLAEVKTVCDGRTLLVLDESSAVKSEKAAQTKACIVLRKKCGRIILLNGTPIANNPGDLFSQAYLMNPAILNCKTYFQFKSKYAIMGGYMNKQIIGWRDLEDIQTRLAPYVLRRLKQDCIDLPPKLDPVVMLVPLSNPTWKIYKSMKDEMVAWLTSGDMTMASQAIVKAIRLAQITSGFVGGLEKSVPLDAELEDRPDFVPKEVQPKFDFDPSTVDFDGAVQELSTEKLDLFLGWLEEQLNSNPNAKILVWCRFRVELARVLKGIEAKFPNVATGSIWGGQKTAKTYTEKDGREHALRLLDPRSAPKGPVVVVGTPSTGSMGLNLTAANTVFYMSNDYSLKTRLQSEDRVHRPGQVNPVNYYDIVATGPSGQKTIDHAVLKALMTKEQMAAWTTSAWLSALREE
jgi:SNF2 family DNA or RNA helicase